MWDSTEVYVFLGGVWRRACDEPAGMMRKDGISDAKYASLPLTVAWQKNAQDDPDQFAKPMSFFASRLKMLSWTNRGCKMPSRESSCGCMPALNC